MDASEHLRKRIMHHADEKLGVVVYCCTYHSESDRNAFLTYLDLDTKWQLEQ